MGDLLKDRKKWMTW